MKRNTFHEIIGTLVCAGRHDLVEALGANLKYVYGDKYWKEATDLAKSEGIYIMRNRELEVTVLSNKKVIAALWVASDNNSFTFDVVVGKSSQSMGIGKKLVEHALLKYRQEGYEEMGYTFEVDCVNMKMVQLLRSKGFRIKGMEGNHTVMIKSTDSVRDANEPSPQTDQMNWADDIALPSNSKNTKIVVRKPDGTQ